jgi:hypothetical protein
MVPIALTSRWPVRSGLGDTEWKETEMAATGAEFVVAMGERCRGVRQESGVSAGGLRFAFYGRMSTREFQDPEMSRAWQRAVSDELSHHDRVERTMWSVDRVRAGLSQ